MSTFLITQSLTTVKMYGGKISPYNKPVFTKNSSVTMPLIITAEHILHKEYELHLSLTPGLHSAGEP